MHGICIADRCIRRQPSPCPVSSSLCYGGGVCVLLWDWFTGALTSAEPWFKLPSGTHAVLLACVGGGAFLHHERLLGFLLLFHHVSL